MWIGDDDYDLFVVTPDGTEISYSNLYDPVSLGRLETEADQEGYGYHLENIYFPMEGAPLGVYRFYVRPFVTVGENDKWIVHVVEAGNTVASETGVGASESFFCKKDNLQPTTYPNTSPTKTFPPASAPSITPIDSQNPNPNISQTDAPDPSPNDILTAAPFISPIAGFPTIFPVASPNNSPADIPDASPSDLNVSPTSALPTVSPAGTPTTNPTIGTPNAAPNINPTSTFPTSSPITSPNASPTIGSPFIGTLTLFPTSDTNPTISNPTEKPFRPPLDQPTMVPDSVLPIIPTDFTESPPSNNNDDGPRRPKPEPPACNLSEEQCCRNADCIDKSGSLCVQRTCIHEGSLRISLEWIGDDNLHLIVDTPEEVAITNDMNFDVASGGRHESSDDSTFGFNVENVYFPISGAPTGKYEIYVDASEISGQGADLWTMRIYEDGEIRFEETGFGKSNAYLYDITRANTLVPTSASKPSVSPSNSQIDTSGVCNDNSACVGETQVCVWGFCISEGNPRFTLQWPGGSFYSLTVVTPDGRQISAFSPFDADSGGVFEGPTQQRTRGDEIESIYFPLQGSPKGLYTYYVTNSGGGNSKESWIATVYVDGENVAMKTGFGSSNRFYFEFGGSPEDDDSNNSQPRGCIATADCLSLDEICYNEICITKGTPQFVLAWAGDDKISLSVATPLKTTVSSEFSTDLKSGGEFQRIDITDNANRHIENIYFSADQSPDGVYPFFIHSDESEGDLWRVSVVVDGEEIVSHSGQGTSEILFFDYSRKIPSIDSPDEEQCDPAKVECCANEDCESNSICVHNACLKKGAPQFLLSCDGDNDIAISVVAPTESIISWQHPLDIKSGGKFEEYFDNQNNRRLENIYFAPDEGPLGVYPYYIHSFETDSDDDTWTLTIYVDGHKVKTENGKGSSEVLFFEYSGDNIAKYPTINPTMNPTISPILQPINQVEEDEEECNILAEDSGECCFDSDCFPNEACASQTCVDEGNPRFTLSWKGSNDLDLRVLTPLGTAVSYSRSEDLKSGGKFGENFDQFEYGLHVENIYFPLDGGPIGEYLFYVKGFLSNGSDDEWTVGVYVDGKEQYSVSGTGDSEELSFTYLPESIDIPLMR